MNSCRTQASRALPCAVESAWPVAMQSLIERIGGPNPRNDRVNACLGKTLHFDPEAEQMI